MQVDLFYGTFRLLSREDSSLLMRGLSSLNNGESKAKIYRRRTRVALVGTRMVEPMYTRHRGEYSQVLLP